MDIELQVLKKDVKVEERLQNQLLISNYDISLIVLNLFETCQGKPELC